MGGTDFQRQVYEGYQAINDRWMGIHVRLLLYCALASGLVEGLMFFVIRGTDMLNCSVGTYWLKYVIAPFLINACLVGLGYFVLHCKRLSTAAKPYIISLLFVALSFVLELMHSGFLAVMAVAFFPVLMTIMYEDHRLTAVTAVVAIITQLLSGYGIFWDPLKVVNAAYQVNLFILIAATICTWLACRCMIGFMRMKREIILSNDAERFRLQRDINIDGLTGVGNKLALTARLDVAVKDPKDVKYLAMLDLDEFKKINDTYGHIFGDDVLRCMGEALRGLGEGADPYRYGGDEFCVVFATGSPEAAIQAIKRVQDYLREHVEMPDGRMNIFISAGIAGYSKGGTSTELLQRADEALYEAKKNSRNGIVMYKKDPR